MTLEEQEKNEDLLSIQGLKTDAQILDVISPTVFKSCFSFRLHILAAKGKYQEVDFGKKTQNQTKIKTTKTLSLSLPILTQTQTTFEVIFTALTFLNSVRYLRTCILLIIYSTVAQKFIGKKGI